MKRIYLIIIAFIIFVTFGCGSGGGGGGEDDTQVNPLSNVIRTYKIGDSVTYEMTFKDIESGQKVNGDVTSRVVGEVTNPYGIRCKVYEFSGTLTDPDGVSYPYIVKGLFYQDTQGNIYGCGRYDEDTGSFVYITNTQDTPNGLKLKLKNPVRIGDIFSGIVYFDDGSWKDCTTSIVGIEVVTTLMGKYETYKESESCNLSDGITIVGTSWFYPSIDYVKGSGIGYGLELIYNMKDYYLVQ